MTTIQSFTGRVNLTVSDLFGAGDNGTLEVKIINGKPHAYINLDNGARLHVPASPVADRELDKQGRIVLSVTDKSHGDSLKSTWRITRLA